MNKFIKGIFDNSLVAHRLVNSDSYVNTSFLGRYADEFMRGIVRSTNYTEYHYFMDLILDIHLTNDIPLLVHTNFTGNMKVLSVHSIINEETNNTIFMHYVPSIHGNLLGTLQQYDEYATPTTKEFLPLSTNFMSVVLPLYSRLVNEFYPELTWGQLLESLFSTARYVNYQMVYPIGHFNNLDEVIQVTSSMLEIGDLSW